MTSVGSIHEGFGSEQDDYTSPKKKKIICEEIEKDKLPCKSADTFLGEAYILVSCVLVTLKNYGRSTPFFITLVLNKKKNYCLPQCLSENEIIIIIVGT